MTDTQAGETLPVPVAELRPSLEAVLMVADQPLDVATLATAVGYPTDEVQGALEALARGYTDERRGFDLRNVAGGGGVYTPEEEAPPGGGFGPEGQQAPPTQGAPQT